MYDDEIMTTQKKLEEALTYCQTGEFQKAKGLYQKILKDFPTQLQALTNLGVIELQLGFYEEGVALLSRSIDINPNQPQILSNLANGLMELDRNDEAIKTFKKAIQIDKNYAEAFYNLGRLYKKINKFDEAIESYTECLKLKIWLDLDGKLEKEDYTEKEFKKLDKLILEKLKTVEDISIITSSHYNAEHWILNRDTNTYELKKTTPKLSYRITYNNEYCESIDDIKNIYSLDKKNIHKKEFDYNHKYKYCSKIDTGDDNIRVDSIEFYKKEQEKQENNKKKIDNVLNNLINIGAISDDLNSIDYNKINPDELEKTLKNTFGDDEYNKLLAETLKTLK
jgi:tetratricopeptide (TPR) repeat protein